MERVLAFGCHPDDVEFMCGGTLALLARMGHEIHIATMTGGEVGSPTLTREEIQRVRLGEAKRAAEIIGGKYHYAGGCDLEVEFNCEYRKMATRVVREANPTIVFTCPPMDYLADHEQTSLLVRNACYIATVPLYDCGAEAAPGAKFPYLYYWNAVGLADIFGRKLPMHMGVDVSEAMGTKEKMLASHESQRAWLKAHTKWDSYMEQMKDLTRKQGELIGKPWGECFMQHRNVGHPQDNILKKIMPGLCVELS